MYLDIAKPRNKLRCCLKVLELKSIANNNKMINFFQI